MQLWDKWLKCLSDQNVSAKTWQKRLSEKNLAFNFMEISDLL